MSDSESLSDLSVRRKELRQSKLHRLLDCHDDFAELVIRLQKAVGFDDFSERKCLGDDWLESTCLQSFNDERFGPL